MRRRSWDLAPPDIRSVSLPLMRTAPEVGSSSVPAIVSSEDLPDPDGPMTATISPACDGEGDVAQRLHLGGAAAVHLGYGS